MTSLPVAAEITFTWHGFNLRVCVCVSADRSSEQGGDHSNDHPAVVQVRDHRGQTDAVVSGDRAAVHVEHGESSRQHKHRCVNHNSWSGATEF